MCSKIGTLRGESTHDGIWSLPLAREVLCGACVHCGMRWARGIGRCCCSAFASWADEMHQSASVKQSSNARVLPLHTHFTWKLTGVNSGGMQQHA